MRRSGGTSIRVQTVTTPSRRSWSPRPTPPEGSFEPINVSSEPPRLDLVHRSRFLVRTIRQGRDAIPEFVPERGRRVAIERHREPARSDQWRNGNRTGRSRPPPPENQSRPPSKNRHHLVAVPHSRARRERHGTVTGHTSSDPPVDAPGSVEPFQQPYQSSVNLSRSVTSRGLIASRRTRGARCWGRAGDLQQAERSPRPTPYVEVASVNAAWCRGRITR